MTPYKTGTGSAHAKLKYCLIKDINISVEFVLAEIMLMLKKDAHQLALTVVNCYEVLKFKNGIISLVNQASK